MPRSLYEKEEETIQAEHERIQLCTQAWVPNSADNAKRKREYEEACASERRFFDHQNSKTQAKPRNTLKRNCDGKSKLQRQVEKKNK